MYIRVFSNRRPGSLPGDFDNRYAWVQILAPECQEPVQMKLKIQMKHLESIQMKWKIQIEPIESIQMELIILGNFLAFLLIVRVLLINVFKLINQNAEYYCCLIFPEQFCCFSKDSI